MSDKACVSEFNMCEISSHVYDKRSQNLTQGV